MNILDILDVLDRYDQEQEQLEKKKSGYIQNAEQNTQTLWQRIQMKKNA